MGVGSREDGKTVSFFVHSSFLTAFPAKKIYGRCRVAI